MKLEDLSPKQTFGLSANTEYRRNRISDFAIVAFTPVDPYFTLAFFCVQTAMFRSVISIQRSFTNQEQ